MVCIAAFIILIIVGIFVAFISIFNPKVGKRYLKILKKSWGCVGKRVTLQKCETGFGDEVKNSILSRVLIRKPKLVKPLSVVIEAFSILLVIVTIWSVVEGAKAGLALWSLGTCNVQRPEACSLGAEICSIDGDSGPKNPIEAVGYWFSDWGEIFGAIPDKFRNWDVSEFDLKGIDIGEGDVTMIDIFDPGCVVCLQSFRNQLKSGYFDAGHAKIRLVPFPIQDAEGKFKYKNSKLIVGYILGAKDIKSDDNNESVSFRIIKRIYTEKDAEHRSYQDLFNDFYSTEEAEETMKKWLVEFGLNEEQVSAVSKFAHSDEFDAIVSHNNDIVVNTIHAKGIPTMIYDGKKHTGRWEE